MPARSCCAPSALRNPNKRVPVQLEDAPMQPVHGANGVVGKAIDLLDAQLISDRGGRASPGRLWHQDQQRLPTRWSLAFPSTSAGHICGLSPSTSAVLSLSKGPGRRLSKPARSSEEGGGDAGVDGNVQAGGVTQISRAEHEDSVGDVLRQHLALQQRTGGEVLAELLFGDAVDRGSLGTPAAGEDARATDHSVGIDAVHLDAVLPQLRGEQSNLMRLVGLRS